MSIIAPGRPNKYSYNQIHSIPRTTGIYRIRTEEGEYKYIGLSNDVHRRIKEHKKSGKLEKTDTIEVLKVKPTEDTNELNKKLAEAERFQIKKHPTTGNKSKGGEGRPANTFYGITPKQESTAEVSITESKFEEIAKNTGKRIWIRRLIVLAIIIAIGILIACNQSIQDTIVTFFKGTILPTIEKIIYFVKQRFGVFH